jgi:DNA-binding MarR family transcriptional regulator
MDKPTGRIEYESMLLQRHMYMRVQAGRTSGNLERSAYILLSRLQVQGAMSIGELSEAFDLDYSTLNRQTAALVREGLAERIPDPVGGMARKFRLTDDGAQRLEAARAEIVSGLDSVLADWSEADQEAYAGFLKRFNMDIERLSGRPWPRPEG